MAASQEIGHVGVPVSGDGPQVDATSFVQEAEDHGRSLVERIGSMPVGRKALALVAGASLALAACSGGGVETADDTTTTTIEATAEDVGLSTEEQMSNFETSLSERFQGFEAGELSVGPGVDFGANPEERGSGAFGDSTARTREDLAAFHASGTPQSREVLDSLQAVFAGDPENLDRAISGVGYVPIQAHVPVVIEGTTYYVDGEMRTSAEPRSAAAGDVFWLFVNEDGSIVWDASQRADCSNPRMKLVRPVQPGENPPPPVDEIPEKFDDGSLPDDGIPATQDPGTPDNPGPGQAGQTPGPDGYLPGETPPPNNGGGNGGGGNGGGDQGRPPATTSPAPVNPGPPPPASTTTSTTAPNNNTTPKP